MKASKQRVFGSGVKKRIPSEIGKDEYFRLGIANVFFEGGTSEILSEKLPLFLLKKLSFSKLNFEMEALLDTLARYKEGDSYSGKKESESERVVGRLLQEINVGYEIHWRDK